MIVRSNLSIFFSKPGAIIKTNPGIKISTKKTKNNKLIRRILKIVFAKYFAFFLLPIEKSSLVQKLH